MRTARRLGLIAIVAVLGLVGGLAETHSAFATTGATYYVSHGYTGNCASTHLATIAAALACTLADAPPSNNPDTIIILPGTYLEHGLLANSNVKIIGQTSKVTIDGQSMGNVLTVAYHSVTIQSLTIKNGKAESGAGIAIFGSTVHLNNDTIVHNQAIATIAPALGGGVYGTASMAPQARSTSTTRPFRTTALLGTIVARQPRERLMAAGSPSRKATHISRTPRSPTIGQRVV